MKSILLLHDLQDNPWQRKQLLEASGFQVELVKNGQECMTYLEHAIPDIVLIDVLLEGDNGFKVCRAIREKYSKDQLPVILCSQVYRDPVFVKESDEAGAQAYLIKPIELRELIEQVAVLTKSGSRDLISV